MVSPIAQIHGHSAPLFGEDGPVEVTRHLLASPRSFHLLIWGRGTSGEVRRCLGVLLIVVPCVDNFRGRNG